MRPVFIKTFGCKVNYAESISFADLLRSEGFTPLEISGSELPVAAEVERPVVFVNSCCVTKEAERKAAQFVRRIRREHQGAEVLFSGCAARNFATRRNYELAGARVFSFYPEAFEWVKENVGKIEAFDLESGTGAIAGGDYHEIVAGAPPRAVEQPDVIATGDGARATIQSPARSRAFVKVQDGCHNCCTFCIIPFVRPYASRDFSELLAEVDRRLEEGVRELVLTGVNIGHYGLTPIASVHEVASQQHFRRSRLYQPVAGHPNLWDLIDAILSRLDRAYSAGFQARLRISSIEPEEIQPRFFEQLTHQRMCPHLHLPLQSGSDKVLGEMRRLYDVATYMQRVESFRRACPDGALTTDVLVGFPSESEADFAETLEICDSARFERVHAFPFSPRPGTRAALMPQLPDGTAQLRNRRLIEHCSDIADRQWQRFVGTTARVLIEERRNGNWFGHGEAYQQVSVPVGDGAENLVDRIVTVRLDAYSNGLFTAEPESGIAREVSDHATVVV